MPFAIETAQRRFFHENYWIEFEEVFSPKDMTRLQQLWALAAGQNPTASYEKGRDWRLSDPRIERLTQVFHELALELWNERPLYLAFDQVISPNHSMSPMLNKMPLVKALASCFSVESALGCIAVSLSPAASPLVKKSGDEVQEIQGPGSVLAFKTSELVTLEKLDPKQIWWIAVYGSESLRYQPCESDPLKDYFRVKGAAISGKLIQAKIKPIGK
jgi:hypothetical protein